MIITGTSVQKGKVRQVEVFVGIEFHLLYVF